MKLTFVFSSALIACSAPSYALGAADPKQCTYSFPMVSETITSTCEPPSALAPGKIAAVAALSMVGTPYSWGGGGAKGPTLGTGSGARTKGFDCSGLTEYAWARAGVRIGSTSYVQWRSGARIPRAQLRTGDLAFFETNPKRRGPDHVGLTINDTEMVVAPYTGAMVRVESIDRRGFVGIVRPSAHELRWRSVDVTKVNVVK